LEWDKRPIKYCFTFGVFLDKITANPSAGLVWNREETDGP